jgi:hypothetical protein
MQAGTKLFMDFLWAFRRERARDRGNGSNASRGRQNAPCACMRFAQMARSAARTGGSMAGAEAVISRINAFTRRK